MIKSGTSLFHYRITEKLGEGGMGAVWRATDSTLDRDVAIKVLPADFASDGERLARFEREAKVLASLNHPNIGAIYGFHDANGVRFLAMELVPGEDLADRLKKGTVPISDAVDIARQIAAGLEYAHERGIVHRDLKPANIKITPEGTVKVLDFGLAKAVVGDPTGSGATSTPTILPTMTSAGTAMGMILGTAAYMSPEQARGKPVDKRTDIWAFGVVLFEMLAGRRLFEGETISDTLAAVLTRPVELAALPKSVPTSLCRLLARCLERDPKARLRDIGEARIALEGAPDPAPEPGRQKRHPLVWGSAVVAVVSLAVAALSLWNRPVAVPKTMARLTIALPPGAELTSYPAITRDGRTVAYVARQGTDDAQLYLRDLDSFQARAVAGSGGAKQPFFSPDSKWVAFFAQGHLQKTEVAGGAPISVSEAPYAFGGTWLEDDTIIYAATLGSGLMQIPAGGGTPKSLTTPDGAGKGYAHVLPQVLPGQRSVLFRVWGQTQGSAVLSLDSGRWDIVLPSTTFATAMFDAAGGSSGRLLVVDQAAGLRAAPFDPAHPAPTSLGTSVLDNVYSDVETESQAWLAISATGTAVYAPGNPAATSLAWADREGKLVPLSREQDVYREVSISPDGTKAVVRHGLDLWIHDLQRGTRAPLTSGNSSNILPLWSRDGLTIIFASNRGGDWDIYSQPADGSRPPETLLKRPHDQFPYSLSPEETLLFLEISPQTGRDLWALSPDGKASPVRVTPFDEMAAQFAPGQAGGSRWVAYASNESGRSEIYVQSFPGGQNRIPVSSGGGIMPMWSPDGKELFYVTGDAVVSVTMGPNGVSGGPHRLMDRSSFHFNDRFHCYGVSPDGQRLLMIQRDPGSVPRQLNVILNWSDAGGTP